MALASQFFPTELNAELDQAINGETGTNEDRKNIQSLLEAVFVDTQYHLADTNLFTALHHPSSVIRRQALNTFIDKVKPSTSLNDDISIRKSASSLLYDKDSTIASISWSTAAVSRMLPAMSSVEIVMAVKFCFKFWISQVNHNAEGGNAVLNVLVGSLNDDKSGLTSHILTSSSPSSSPPYWLLTNVLNLSSSLSSTSTSSSSLLSESIILLISNLSLYFPGASKSKPIPKQGQDPYTFFVEYCESNYDSVLTAICIRFSEIKDVDDVDDSGLVNICILTSFLLDVVKMHDKCSKQNRENIMHVICMIVLLNIDDIGEYRAVTTLQETLQLLGSYSNDDVMISSSDDVDDLYANARFNDLNDLSNSIGNMICAYILSSRSENIAALLATALHAFSANQSISSRLLALALSNGGADYDHYINELDFEPEPVSGDDYILLSLRRTLLANENHEDKDASEEKEKENKKYICKVNNLGRARAMYALSLYISSMDAKTKIGKFLRLLFSYIYI